MILLSDSFNLKQPKHGVCCLWQLLLTFFSCFFAANRPLNQGIESVQTWVSQPTNNRLISMTSASVGEFKRNFYQSESDAINKNVFTCNLGIIGYAFAYR